MKRALGVAVACSLLCGPALAQLAEYGIEGIWTVSTRDAELRGSVSPDGKRMVWGSDRAGGDTPVIPPTGVTLAAGAVVLLASSAAAAVAVRKRKK